MRTRPTVHRRRPAVHSRRTGLGRMTTIAPRSRSMSRRVKMSVSLLEDSAHIEVGTQVGSDRSVAEYQGVRILGEEAAEFGDGRILGLRIGGISEHIETSTTIGARLMTELDRLRVRRPAEHAGTTVRVSTGPRPTR